MASRYDDIKSTLKARLAGITRANGYQTDLGNAIYLNREWESVPDDVPGLYLYLGEMQHGTVGEVPPSLGEDNHLLPIRIVGAVVDDESGTEAEKARADLHKALTADVHYGGLTEGYENAAVQTTVEVRTIDEGNVGLAQASGTIFYVTEAGGF